jgi:predicted  nucleic acid-binding Zn-ribbon protein
MENRIEIEIVLDGEERARRGIQNTRQTVEQLSTSLSSTNSVLGNMGNKLQNVGEVTRDGLAGAFVVASASVSAFAVHGINLNSTLENMHSITASLIALNMPNAFGGKIISEAEKTNNVLGLTAITIDKISASSKNALVSTKEFGQITNYALGVALKNSDSMGGSYKNVIDNTIKASERLTRALVLQGVEAEDIGEQLRMLFSGELGNDEFLASFGFTEEGIAEAKSKTDGLAKYINEKLDDIEPYINADSWTGAVALMKRDFDELTQIATEPLFEDLRKEILGFSPNVKEIGKELQNIYYSGVQIKDTLAKAFDFKTPNLVDFSNELFTAKNIAMGLSTPVLVFTVGLENAVVFVKRLALGFESIPLYIEKILYEFGNLASEMYDSFGDKMYEIFGIDKPIDISTRGADETKKEIGKIGDEIENLKREAENIGGYSNFFDEWMELYEKAGEKESFTKDLQRFNSVSFSIDAKDEATKSLSKIKNIAEYLTKKYKDNPIFVAKIEDFATKQIKEIRNKINSLESQDIAPKVTISKDKLDELFSSIAGIGDEFAQLEMQKINIDLKFKPILDISEKIEKALETETDKVKRAMMKSALDIAKNAEQLKADELKEFEIKTFIKPSIEFLDKVGAKEVVEKYKKELLDIEFEEKRDLVLKYKISQIVDFEKDDELFQMIIDNDIPAKDIALRFNLNSEEVEEIIDLYKIIKDGREEYNNKPELPKDKELQEFTENLEKTFENSLSSGIQSALEGDFDFSSFSQSLANSIFSAYSQQLAQNVMSVDGLFSGMAGGGWGMAGAFAISYAVNNWDNIKGGQVSKVGEGFSISEDLTGYYADEIEQIQSYEKFKKEGGWFQSDTTWTKFSEISKSVALELRESIYYLNKLSNEFSGQNFTIKAGVVDLESYYQDLILDMNNINNRYAGTITEMVSGGNYSEQWYEKLLEEYSTQNLTPDEINEKIDEEMGRYFSLSYNQDAQNIISDWQKYAEDVGMSFEEAIAGVSERLSENITNIKKTIAEIDGASTYDLDIEIAQTRFDDIFSIYEDEISNSFEKYKKDLYDIAYQQTKQTVSAYMSGVMIDEGLSLLDAKTQVKFNSLFKNSSLKDFDIEDLDLNSWLKLIDEFQEANNTLPATTEMIDNITNSLIELEKAEHEREQALKSQKKSLQETFDSVSGATLFGDLEKLNAMERLGVASQGAFLDLLEDFASNQEFLTTQQSEDILLLGSFFQENTTALEDLAGNIQDLGKSISDYQQDLSLGNLSPLLEEEKTSVAETELDDLYKQFDNILVGGITNDEFQRASDLVSEIQSGVSDYLTSAQETLGDADYLSTYNLQIGKLNNYASTLSNLEITQDPVVSAIDRTTAKVEELIERIQEMEISLKVETDLEATYKAFQDKGLI